MAVERFRSIAQNRRARYDYFIDETLEAGLILHGTEVKSLRNGRASLNEAYEAANRFNHEPRRPRDLLVHKRERDRLLGLVRRDGCTLVPLRLYFNPRGIVKLEVGVARGKRQVDKRQDKKKRDWQREKSRLIREKG